MTSEKLKVEINYKHNYNPEWGPILQGSDLAVGYDLRAAIAEPLYLHRGALIPCGISIGLPLGLEAQIRPRSGFSTKNHIIIPNSPGTVDGDFRGELKVYLLNLGEGPVVIEPGQRIAQLVFALYKTIEFVDSVELSTTKRGVGGFGSTGK